MPKPKAKFLVKKHKKKGQGDDFHYVAAIHDNTEGKQVAQLSSRATPDFDTIVNSLVSQLNEGNKTLDQARTELDDIKTAQS